MEGASFLREGRPRGSGTTSGTVYHLLEIACGGHKFVTRSTFASELFAAVNAADTLVPLATTFHELATGHCRVLKPGDSERKADSASGRHSQWTP